MKPILIVLLIGEYRNNPDERIRNILAVVLSLSYAASSGNEKMIRTALLASSLLALAAPAAAEDLIITDTALKGVSFERLVNSPTLPRQCLGDPLVLRNGASRAVSIDLYEAQTDVAFPFGRLAPGASKPIQLSRPARIVAVNAGSGEAIAYVEVVACAKTQGIDAR